MSENHVFSPEELDLLRGLPRRAGLRSVRELVGPVARWYVRCGHQQHPAGPGRTGPASAFQPFLSYGRTVPAPRLGDGRLPGRHPEFGWHRLPPSGRELGPVYERLGMLHDLDFSGEVPVMAGPVREVDEEDRAFLESYVPKIPADRWLAIREFVLEVMLDYLPYSTARPGPQIRHLVAYVDWMHRVADVELDRERLLDPDMIAYYIEQVPELSPSSRTTRRATLLRMCDFLLPDMRRTVRMKPIGTGPASKPYSPEEIKRLKRLAMEQSTPYSRHAAWCMLAFGLGAGLAASELATLRREDVVEDRHGVFVHVRQPNRNQPRVVPVLDEFADEAIVLARCATPGHFVFRPDRTSAGRASVGDWANRLKYHDELKFLLPRMRATWVVRHLNAGVPAQAVIAAAGMTSFTALDRYASYLDELTENEVRELIGAYNHQFSPASALLARQVPHRVERERAKSQAWYAANREQHLAKCRERYARKRAEAKRAQFKDIVS